MFRQTILTRKPFFNILLLIFNEPCYSRLIGKLLIGYVDTTSSGSGGSIEKSDADGFAMPAPKPPNKSAVAPTLLSTEAETEEEDAVNPWEKETDAD